MKFSALSLFLAFFTFFSAVTALPSGHTFMRASCDIGKCVAALAPTVVGCVAAAAKKGADIARDASCLAAAANVVENFPASCDSCLTEFDIAGKAKSAANAVEHAAGAAAKEAGHLVDEAGNVVGKIGSEIGSFF
ncbi:hypothetical protein LshimejAT787_2100390 [Lyophyllum shimeji]|uniref:Fungal calcium binding protein domain-containing protein n=1 Tax=Lyophyllum shimeji TaxID=47721 RepID=A0A9P3URN0_LYOSH|nr:hypothetical protein LshimejAT787_2100390 [Lyophyllum shimeji]